MRKIELLVPASSLEVLKIAVIFGADAVYIGGEAFGLRAKAKNFSHEDMKEGIAFAHEHGVKVYVTVNILAHNYDLPGVREYLTELKELKPDALIIADPGIYMYAKEICPEIEIHISTQANNTNYGTYQFWYAQGAKRVVSARELSLAEIKEIREKIPEDMEIETFIHGAMCISYSGRCLLSGFFTGRDANHGKCAQPCRWEYKESEKTADICEIKRPDAPLSLVEDARGTYMFSSKDMCMIGHIPELTEAGINSFKIEGRVKSAYYTAVTAIAYKTELLKYLADKEHYTFDGKSLYELESVSHREYATGFFFDDCSQNAQITQNGGYLRDKAFLATVSEIDEKTGRALLLQRNKACEGDECELVSPGKGSVKFTLTDLRNQENEKIDSAPHAKMLYSVKMTVPMKAGDIIRGANR